MKKTIKNKVKHLKKFKPLNRKKADPNQFTYTGESSAERTDIQIFKYNKETCNEIQSVIPGDIHKVEAGEYMQWLNVYGLSDPDAIALICNRLNIHQLVIQDILDLSQRPKFQEFDNFSFLTIKSTVPSESELLTEQLSFVFGKNYLVSFQEKKADYFDHLRQRLRENKGIIRERGSDYLLYTMLESILDNYFKTLNHLETELENINFVSTRQEPSPDVLELIENHKKLVWFIKNAILPVKEYIIFVERRDNPLFEKRHLKYYFELKDMCMTLLDSCDTLLSSLESKTNLFFYVQGYRMNQVMKTLTIIATIFIPLTFIAGIYGMNFTNMPELHWKHGYAAVWILILLLITGMIIWFKKRKWF